MHVNYRVPFPCPEYAVAGFIFAPELKRAEENGGGGMQQLKAER
jgi:hypothetical protein